MLLFFLLWPLAKSVRIQSLGLQLAASRCFVQMAPKSYIIGAMGASRPLVATSNMVSVAGSRGQASLQMGVCSLSQAKADLWVFCLHGCLVASCLSASTRGSI